MLFVKHGPGESSPDHTHEWEHQAFITEGSGILVCGGKEYPVKTGDAVLVPGGIRHQFINTGDVPLHRVTVNPVESVEHKFAV
jgi:mannose-6-phosphate isomerase-like protein (cupin superfamily)